MSSVRAPSIAAFFPCHNDAGTIASMVLEALVVLAALTDDFEVIVVENGSRDATALVLAELERLYGARGADPRFGGRLRVLRFDAPLGYGGALREGFAAARKELVFYTDGDAQYDVRELPRLLAALAPDVDVVMGNKMKRADSLARAVIGRAYHGAVKRLFNLGVHDTDCDFRLIRKTALARFSLEKSSGVAPLELVAKLEATGARIVEIPVRHFPRAYGSSQFFRVRPIAEVLVDVGKLWFARRAPGWVYPPKAPNSAQPQRPDARIAALAVAALPVEAGQIGVDPKRAVAARSA